VDSAEWQPPPSALGTNSDSHDGSTPVQNGSAGTSPAAPADPSIALAGNALPVAPSGTPARGTSLASSFSRSTVKRSTIPGGELLRLLPTYTTRFLAHSVCSPIDQGIPMETAAHREHSVTSPTPKRPAGPMAPSSNSPSLHGPAADHLFPVSQPLSFRPAFHQAHPSNGSLVFGGFHDSNASSPAPHSSGGFPPPNMMAAYPAGPPLDTFGRPFLMSPTFDGYHSVAMNNHGPPTPHSFHGSQSSAQADDYGHGPYGPVNGHNGHLADPIGRTPMPGVHMNGSLHLANPSVSVYQNLREHDACLAFLRSGWGDAEFTDCVLEMRFRDGSQHQDHPDFRHLATVVRLPAHRFILSRSPTLASLLRSRRVAPGGTLILDLVGEYMRSDIFCFALRTLYGWSIGDGVPPSELPLRNIRDDFKLSLGYIVVSEYLQAGWLHSAVVQRASGLLCWETAELAANFILPRVLTHRSRTDEFNLSVLREEFLAFLAKNFPKDFKLDVDVVDGEFARLPALGPAQSTNGPTIANGSSSPHHSRQSSVMQAHLPMVQRVSANPRLSQIKFGDISPPQPNGFDPNTPPDTTQSHPAISARDSILSRILLNLPYEFLKRVLEDPHLAVATGELDREQKFRIITDIVAERESRRMRALDKSQPQLPQLQILQETLEQSAAPRVVEQMGDFLVNNMGFKEDVCPGDSPFLVHTWNKPGSGSAAA